MFISKKWLLKNAIKISNYSFLHVKRMVSLLLRRVFKSGGRLNSNFYFYYREFPK